MEIFIAILSGGLLSTLVSFFVTRKSIKSNLKKTELESINIKLDTLNKLNEYMTKELDYHHNQIDYLSDIKSKYAKTEKILNNIKDRLEKTTDINETAKVEEEFGEIKYNQDKLKDELERNEATYRVNKESSEIFMKIRNRAIKSLNND
jgi:hypothetical protein